MSEEAIQNARIESTQLGSEDHGVMTFWLILDYGGSGQGFGGFCLDGKGNEGDAPRRRVGTAFGLQAIMEVLRVTGVGTWEKLPGTPVRVRGTLGFGSGPITALGHYLKDEWLDLEELAKEFQSEPQDGS